jgi:hypothetical protein
MRTFENVKSSSDIADIVTILASLPSYEGGERKAATKTITPDGKGGLAITDIYKGTKWWSGHERTVDSIDSFATLLEKGRDPFAMIVRGRIADGVNRDRMFRRKTTRADGTGTIDEAEHRWLLIDADSLEADFDPFEDVPKTVRYVCDRLPAAFRGVTCWFQFTSGAGIKPGIRIRLAFWLDRALGTEDLKLWFGAKADKIRLYPVDLSVFVCSHPIYVAHPILATGAWCPLGGRPRSGVVRGESDTVVVPTIERPQYEPGSRTSTWSDSPRSASFDEALSWIGDHEGGGGCHRALLHVTGWYFGRYGSDADPEALKAAIEETVAKACWDAKAGHDSAYIASQMGDELDRLIGDIQQRQRDDEAREKYERELATRRWPEDGLQLQEAESVLREQLDRFFDEIVRIREQPETTDDIFTAPQIGINVAPGTGKTQRATSKMVATKRPYVLAIPTHAKAEEIEALASRFASRKVARVWRGLKRQNPNADNPEETMCQRAKVVEEFQRAGGKRESICAVCPLAPGCAYLEQESAEPDIWVVPHSLLTSQPPKTMQRAMALIIDEGRSLETKRYSLAITELTASRKYRPDILPRVEAALRDTKAGEFFSRDVLTAASITHAMAEHAHEYEASNFPKIRVFAADSDEQILERIAKKDGDIKLTTLRRRFWRELERFLAAERGDTDLSTRLRLSKDGTAIEIDVLLATIHENWLTRPVLYLDGSLNELVARNWLPRLEVAADIRVRRGAGVFVRQVVDQAVAYGKIIPGVGVPEKPDPAAAGKREAQERMLRRILRKVDVTCTRYRAEGCTVGLIAPKGFLEAATAVGWAQPLNLVTANFGAIRGLNSLERVSHLIVLGRPEPKAADIENIARVALDMHPDVSLAGQHYPKRNVGLRMADSSAVRVEEAYHPDPAVHAILEQARCSEVAQAVHRCRPIRRPEERPVTVEIISNTVIDITVDEAVTFDQWLEVSVDDLLLSRGFVPDDWAGKAAVLRDIYPTPDAVRMAAARAAGCDPRNAFDATSEQTPIKESLYKENVRNSSNAEDRNVKNISAADILENARRRQLSDVGRYGSEAFPKYRYRLRDKRQGATVAIDIDRHPDPRAAWAEELGVAAADFEVWELEPLDFSYLPRRQPKIYSPPLQPARARRFVSRLPKWSKRQPLIKRDLPMWFERIGL